MDLQELRQRAAEGKPLYGSSNQPEWVQHAASTNSTFSQLKFGAPSLPNPWLTTHMIFLLSLRFSCYPNVCPSSTFHLSTA